MTNMKGLLLPQDYISTNIDTPSVSTNTHHNYVTPHDQYEHCMNSCFSQILLTLQLRRPLSKTFLHRKCQFSFPIILDHIIGAYIKVKEAIRNPSATHHIIINSPVYSSSILSSYCRRRSISVFQFRYSYIPSLFHQENIDTIIQYLNKSR